MFALRYLLFVFAGHIWNYNWAGKVSFCAHLPTFRSVLALLSYFECFILSVFRCCSNVFNLCGKSGELIHIFIRTFLFQYVRENCINLNLISSGLAHICTQFTLVFPNCAALLHTVRLLCDSICFFPAFIKIPSVHVRENFSIYIIPCSRLHRQRWRAPPSGRSPPPRLHRPIPAQITPRTPLLQRRGGQHRLALLRGDHPLLTPPSRALHSRGGKVKELLNLIN